MLKLNQTMFHPELLDFQNSTLEHNSKPWSWNVRIIMILNCLAIHKIRENAIGEQFGEQEGDE